MSSSDEDTPLVKANDRSPREFSRHFLLSIVCLALAFEFTTSSFLSF